MANSANTNKKYSQGKILKKLPENPTCLAVWITKSGKKYYVIFDKQGQIHSVYTQAENGYRFLFSTKDYYKIANELERIDNGR